MRRRTPSAPGPRRSRTGRAAAVLSLSLLLGAGFVPFAPAASALEKKDAFVAAGLARALHLDVLGVGEETLGKSEGKISSIPKAVAEAAGSLTLASGTETKAEVGPSSGTERDPGSGQSCGAPTIDLPDPLKLDLGVACSSALAKVSSGHPSYDSDASVASLDLNASTVLSTATTPLKPVLEPVFGALPPDVGNTVSSLVEALGTQKTLEGRLGDSSSTATTTANTVKVESVAKAGRIDILPAQVSDVNPVPYLIRIEIGSASATAERNRKTGDASSAFDPAIVTVKFAPIAGQQIPDQVVSPGQSVELPLPAPLQSEITVANGQAFQRSDGSMVSVADGVKIHLFKGLMESSAGAADGGILLELAHAEAAIGGSPLEVTKTADPTKVKSGEEFTTTIDVHNPHECPLHDVKVTDEISVQDASLFKIVDTTPDADSFPTDERRSSATVKWNDIGDIGPGDTKSVKVTLLAQGGDGKIVDIATAAGTFGDCQASAEDRADVIAAALAQVPVSAQARVQVPEANRESGVPELPRTGADAGTATAAGVVLAGIASVARRRFL